MTDIDRSKFLGVKVGLAIPPWKDRAQLLHLDVDLRMTRFDLVVGGLIAVTVLWLTTRLVEAEATRKAEAAVEPPRPIRPIEAEIAAVE